jgi:hypothetical protein
MLKYKSRSILTRSAFAIASLAMSAAALAQQTQTFGDIAHNANNSLVGVTDFIPTALFTVGMCAVLWGGWNLWKHVKDEGRTPMAKGLGGIVVGALMLYVFFFTDLVGQSFLGTGAAAYKIQKPQQGVYQNIN